MPASDPEDPCTTSDKQGGDSDDEIRRPGRSRKAVLNDSSDDDSDLLFKKSLLAVTSEKNDSEPKNDESSDVDSDADNEVIRRKPNRLKKQLDDEDSLTSPIKTGVNSVDHQGCNGSRNANTKNSDSDSDTSKRPGSRSSSRKSNDSSSSSGSDSDVSSAGEDDDGISLEAIRSKIVKKHLPSKSAKVLNEVPGEDPERKGSSKPPKGKAFSRKAKEAALAEIHSETQRMIRERRVSLPYHKPKQRSLEDFLNRRKMAPSVPLKTTSDELAKVWKHVEERERMAASFYKSESDEESSAENAVDKASNTISERTASAVDSERAENCIGNNGNSLGIESENSAGINGPDLSPTTTGSQRIPLGPAPENEDSLRLQLTEATQSDTAEDSIQSIQPIQDGSPADNSENTDTHNVPKPVLPPGDQTVEAAPASSPANSNEDSGSNSISLDDIENSASTKENTQSEMSYLSSLSEKINSMNLPIATNPRISGAPDELIDLDELTTKPGAFGLMQRFIKHAKLKPKKVAQDSLVSVTSADISDCGEVISVSKETIKVKKEEQKPGEKLTVLKTTLQQKIAENRELQLAKRMEEYKLYEEEFYGADGTSDNELEEELLGDNSFKDGGKEGFEEDAPKSSDEEPAEEIEEALDEADKEDFNNPFLENEADESDEGDKEDDKSEAEETASVLLGDDDEDSTDEKRGGSDSSEEDEEEGEPLSVPPIPSGLRSLAGTQNIDDGFGESQLAALCSGNFSSAPAGNSTEGESLKHDINVDSDDEEIVGKKRQTKNKRKLTFSDEEEEGEDIVSKPTASDESQDEDEPPVGEPDTDEEKEADNVRDISDSDEPLQGLDDEDDEETMLAKKLSKGFLEKEAELSESEWGSDDEDEQGLDRYEEEEGDKDKISQRRLQRELGKIHMREVQAEDTREVRLLQELLLEDGELHSDGPKRQRLFRWYNQDEDNPNEKRGLDFGENGNENDEEDEDTWRRQRLERENFLRKKKIDNLELEIVDSPVVFNDTRKSVKPTTKVTTSAPKSPDVKSNFSIFMKRGSFLGRGEKMLSKLAEITNSVGTKENPLGNSRNNRNMVFSALSPPKTTSTEELETENSVKKRKGEFLATSVVKKIKFTSSNGKTQMSALEQLKLYEG